jgi:hypothetical protein
MLMSCVVYFLQGAHSLGLGLRVEEKPKTIGFCKPNPILLRKSGFCLPCSAHTGPVTEAGQAIDYKIN